MEAITPHPLTAVSEEQLKAFLEAVKADAGLQEKLKEAAGADAVVAIAKAAGFAISAEELVERSQAELSDEELERVAGGGTPVAVVPLLVGAIMMVDYFTYDQTLAACS